MLPGAMCKGNSTCKNKMLGGYCAVGSRHSVLRFPADIFPLVVVPVWCKLKFGPSVGPGSLFCRLAFAVTCSASRATVPVYSPFRRLRSLALGGACGFAAPEFLVVSSVPPGAGEGSELCGRHGTSRAINIILSYSTLFPYCRQQGGHQGRGEGLDYGFGRDAAGSQSQARSCPAAGP